jgi:hypothetical protein
MYLAKVSKNMFSRALVFLLLLAAAGCSKGSSSTGPDESKAKVSLAQGWQDFEGQRFDSAVNDFTTAFTAASLSAERGEALTGRGWSYAYKRNLPSARADLVFATGVSGIDAGVLSDARVGAAFVLYGLNDFTGAAAYADTALTRAPSYTFSHDSKVTAKRVRLLLAQSYFANGQFSQAASQMDIFDTAHAPHSSDPAVLLGSISAALSSL